MLFNKTFYYYTCIVRCNATLLLPFYCDMINITSVTVNRLFRNIIQENIKVEKIDNIVYVFLKIDLNVLFVLEFFFRLFIRKELQVNIQTIFESA